MRLVLIAVLVATLGCAGLIVNDHDSTAKKTAKISTRVLLGVTTLGLSELSISQNKQKRKTLEHWSRWRDAVRSARSVHEINQLFGSGPISCTPTQVNRQSCVWKMGEKGTAFIPIGRTVFTIPTGTVVTAICEVPTDGTPIEPGSCSFSVQ